MDSRTLEVAIRKAIPELASQERITTERFIRILKGTGIHVRDQVEFRYIVSRINRKLFSLGLRVKWLPTSDRWLLVSPGKKPYFIKPLDEKCLVAAILLTARAEEELIKEKDFFQLFKGFYSESGIKKSLNKLCNHRYLKRDAEKLKLGERTFEEIDIFYLLKKIRPKNQNKSSF